MELGEKLSELNLTEEEMGRFAKAFKDDNFRKMLRDYAEEISDPENRKRYEEEIAILEQERGNSVQFIHPSPFKCVRTSVHGKQRCYVNICANDNIGKPQSERGVSEDGRSGLHWSLPHSLHPERREVDSKGNKIIIYDVIFHPDTVHMASTNDRFMEMVTNVALQGIEDAFKVKLDRNNVKFMSRKYKGNPQACVIRKPIPGFKEKDVKDDPEPLAFPYPDIKAAQCKDKNSKNELCQPKSATKSQEPTIPHYTLKYRSYIDLQDFRCSPDSGQSPTPKEIVITIDLPLLKSVAAASLEVKERSLCLESENPKYRLELPLAYAVDEDRGEAKFNRQSRQLVVTLPVRPRKLELTATNQGQETASGTQDERDNTVEGDEKVKDGEDGEEKGSESQMEISREDMEEEKGEVSQEHEELESGEKTDGAKMEEKDEKGPEMSEEDTNYTSGVETCELREEERQKGEENQPESEEKPEETNGTSLKSEVQIGEDKKSEKTKASEPVLLREVLRDGSQQLIADHVTSAGFHFHNALLFELD